MSEYKPKLECEETFCAITVIVLIATILVIPSILIIVSIWFDVPYLNKIFATDLVVLVVDAIVIKVVGEIYDI